MLRQGGPLQDKCSLQLWQSGCKSGRRVALAVLLGVGPAGTVVRWCSGVCVVGTARATGIGAHCRAGGDAVVSADVWCKAPCLPLSVCTVSIRFRTFGHCTSSECIGSYFTLMH